MVMVVRLRNPAAIQLPTVKRLFLAALTHGAIDQEYAVQRTAASALDPLVGIWIGIEDGEPKGMIKALLPRDPRIDRPLMDLGANFGSRELGAALLRAAIEFIRSAKYDRAWTLNQSGHSDAAYIRNVRRYGLTAKHWTSILELDLTEKDPEDGHQHKQQ